MSHFDPRVINVNPRSLGRPVLIGIGLVFVLILVWASVAYVPPGSVGVLTSFGAVTGETLPEGTHFVSPFKINHVMTVRTQTQEEHTSTPSSEGLNLEIDTSLYLSLEPRQGGQCLPEHWNQLRPHDCRSEFAFGDSRHHGRPFSQHALFKLTQAGGR